ncbi:MAG: cupin domain-containing protein [Polyangiaceae bacterium]
MTIGAASGNVVQVERALDDLIQRLSRSDSTPAVRAALIEARRLKNVTTRWAAIPPPPDARREMMARVMELVASAGVAARSTAPPPPPLGSKAAETGREPVHKRDQPTPARPAEARAALESSNAGDGFRGGAGGATRPRGLRPGPAANSSAPPTTGVAMKPEQRARAEAAMAAAERQIAAKTIGRSPSATSGVAPAPVAGPPAEPATARPEPVRKSSSTSNALANRALTPSPQKVSNWALPRAATPIFDALSRAAVETPPANPPFEQRFMGARPSSAKTAAQPDPAAVADAAAALRKHESVPPPPAAPAVSPKTRGTLEFAASASSSPEAAEDDAGWADLAPEREPEVAKAGPIHPDLDDFAAPLGARRTPTPAPADLDSEPMSERLRPTQQPPPFTPNTTPGFGKRAAWARKHTIAGIAEANEAIEAVLRGRTAQTSTAPEKKSESTQAPKVASAQPPLRKETLMMGSAEKNDVLRSALAPPATPSGDFEDLDFDSEKGSEPPKNATRSSPPTGAPPKLSLSRPPPGASRSAIPPRISAPAPAAPVRTGIEGLSRTPTRGLASVTASSGALPGLSRSVTNAVQPAPKPASKSPPRTATSVGSPLPPADRSPSSPTQVGLRPATPVPSPNARNVVGFGVTLVRPEAMTWQAHPLLEGVTMRVLFREPQSGRYSAIVRIAPGASLPPRRHASVEEMLVVSGLAKIGEHEIRAGEYCRSDDEAVQSAITTEVGCSLFISGSERDEFINEDELPP